jgi:hypothetical protein
MAKIFGSEGRGPGRREKSTDMGYEKLEQGKIRRKRKVNRSNKCTGIKKK